MPFVFLLQSFCQQGEYSLLDMTETLSTNGTPIDLQEMERILVAQKLGGMPAPIRLLVAEERIDTYEALIAALQSSKYTNPFGNFQLQATDIGRAKNIMGHIDGEKPERYYLVVAKEIIIDLVKALEDIRLETRRKIEDLLGDDDSDQELPPVPARIAA